MPNRVLYFCPRLMYMAHPAGNRLVRCMPSNLSTATANEYRVSYRTMCELRKVVLQLADLIEDEKPDLIPFFATGGIPFLFPVMDILARHRFPNFVDGSRFHMFPGLAWKGKLGGESTMEFFTREFGSLLGEVSSQKSEVRVLAVDSTNVGNAVNLMVRGVCSAWDTINKSGACSLHFKGVGIVDATSPENAKAETGRCPIPYAGAHRYLILPTGWKPKDNLADRHFLHFVHPDESKGTVSLQLAYWLVEDIPTEDEAELLGAHALDDVLGVKTDATPGRIIIEHENGMRQSQGGLDTPGLRFLHLLSDEEGSCAWSIIKQRADIPYLSAKERMSYVEMQFFSESGVRLFELENTPKHQAFDGLAQQHRCLSEVELYWISKQSGVPAELMLKICGSAIKDRSLEGLSLTIFRRNLSSLAKTEPQVESQYHRAWWRQVLRERVQRRD